MNGKLQTIALDIGNVCITIYPERCLQKLDLSPSSFPASFYERYLNLVRLFETGRISYRLWLDSFKELTGGIFSESVLREAYLSILGDCLPATDCFVRKAVERGYRIIFFSDTSPFHLNEISCRLPFANLVSGGVFSFDTGTLKPDNAMFERYNSIYGAPALYLDDKRENIEAGRKAGWNSIQITNPVQNKLF
jgi:FMN phosphatase YigB (HAD superfamily)